MSPPASHAKFFSSLKQVERRLKSEVLPPAVSSSTTLTDQSLGTSPIYLHSDQPQLLNTASTLHDSETPRAFLSGSPEFPPPPHQDSPPYQPTHQVEDDEVDDIQRLIHLLGLSERMQEAQTTVDPGPRGGDGGGGGSCYCESGFFSRIAGVKGPKCGKEVERLEGWVKHFYNVGRQEEESSEPFRLALLLLGKAVSDSGNAGFWGLDFPATMQEFLHNDPPSHPPPLLYKS